MDRSNNVDNNSRLIDDKSRPICDDNGTRKRKRNDESASSSQHGGESREQHTTSLLRALEQSQRALEQSQRVNGLLLENRELRIKLEERDREIEALRRELDRDRDDRSRSNYVPAAGNPVIAATDEPGQRVKIWGNTISNPSTTELDESTDEEIQLSSKSSMDRLRSRQLNNADVDDEAKEEGNDEGKVSSDTISPISYSQLFENNDSDEERKETGGEANNEKQHALADAGHTRSLGNNSDSRLLPRNDTTEVVEGEQEQHAVAEYAAAINHGEHLHGDTSSDESAAANLTSKETTQHESHSAAAARTAVLAPGGRLAIYWPDDNKYYNGTLTEYNAATNKYFVKYDDGDEAWENLEEETYHVLGEVDSEADTASHADGLDMSRAEQEEGESDDEVVEGSGRLAFCCQNCTCNNVTTTVSMYRCHNSGDACSFGNFNLLHKGCCHNERGDVNTFKSPMQLSREQGLLYKTKTDKECSLDKIKQKYENAKRQESKMANEELLAAPASEIYACPEYADKCKEFQQRKGTQKSPLHVLELFSGIGSGTLALKKLRIPLHTVVHCDHDPIANEVCKFNHNHQRDDIKHVYIDTFEEIYGECNEPDEDKIAKLVADYGPFDLVLAGAPCSNYSGLNANRVASCANAQYLPNVGKLITKLNDIQKKHGMKHDVLFLSENVVFKDFDHINKCYGNLPPIRLDARHFSPCERSRFYWCNIPQGNKEKVTNVASQISADCDGILDSGYGLLERLVCDDKRHITVKANTFLASLSKIDDDRMLKYSTGDSGRTKIKVQPYSVTEREKMMGLPAGYVSKPLKKLFHEITTCAILKPETSADGKTYRDFMDRRFWHLRKKIKLQHYPREREEPYFEIGIATPIENKKKLAFFKEEQYCKHLIGMGFSICVVESLLEGLVDLFANDLLKTYERYDYSFPWEPYLSYHRDRQKEAITQSTNSDEERQMEEG